MTGGGALVLSVWGCLRRSGIHPWWTHHDGIVGLLFNDLTVQTTPPTWSFVFRHRPYPKRIRLAEIAEVEPGAQFWLYGWGIHRNRHGWLYNVSGWEAVEMILTSGKHLRLGTDEPYRLMQVSWRRRARGIEYPPRIVREGENKG